MIRGIVRKILKITCYVSKFLKCTAVAQRSFSVSLESEFVMSTVLMPTWLVTST